MILFGSRKKTYFIRWLHIMTEQKKPHFSREYTITFKTKQGLEITESSFEPVDWKKHFVEQETKERLNDYRWITAGEWELKTDDIIGFKVGETDNYVKSLY